MTTYFANSTTNSASSLAINASNDLHTPNSASNSSSSSCSATTSISSDTTQISGHHNHSQQHQQPQNLITNDGLLSSHHLINGLQEVT